MEMTEKILNRMFKEQTERIIVLNDIMFEKIHRDLKIISKELSTPEKRVILLENKIRKV